MSTIAVISIYFIVIATLGLGFLGLFLYYKKIIEFLLLPRIKVGFTVCKFLGGFIANERLNVLIYLRKEMEKKFGHFSQAPLIVIIGKEKPKWLINTAGNLMESSDLYVLINQQMALLWINEDSIESTFFLLNDIMDGRSHTGIIVDIPWKEISNNEQVALASKINYKLNWIRTITGITCSTIFLLNMGEILVNFVGDIASPYTSIGMKFQQSSESYYSEAVKQFQKQLLDIYMADPQMSENGLYPLWEFQNYEDNVMELLATFDSPLYGLFLSAKNQQNQSIFVSDVFHIHATTMSSNYQIKTQNNATPISSYIYWFLIAIAVVLTGFALNNQYKLRNLIGNSIDNCLGYLENYQDQTIWEDISNLKLEPSLVNANIYKEEVHKLHRISEFMINKQLENSDMESSFYNEAFDFSPVDTKNFYYLDRSVNELTLRLKSMGSVERNKERNKQFSDYTNSLRTNIIKCFDHFFQTFKNSNLVLHFEHLENLLNQMSSKNTNLQVLVDLKNAAHDMQQLFGMASNEWWINKNLGNAYNDLLNRVGAVDPHLKQTILQNQELALQKFIDRILSAEHILCGKIVNIESQLNGKKLVYSNGITSLLNTINYIIQEPLVNIASQDVQIGQIPEGSITIWDLNQLDSLLTQITARNNLNILLNNIRNNGSNGPLIANITASLTDNNLKDYFVNSIKQAHGLKPLNISLEDKVKNLLQAGEKLETIEKFVVNTFGIKLYFLEEITKDSLQKIITEIRKTMDNSIFTSYLRLKSWKEGEDLVQSLFQCTPDELGILFSKSMVTLQQLKNRVLVPILSYLLFDMEQYEYVKYIIDQITKYETNTYNHIKSFEDFIISLKDWKLIWRPPVNLLTSSKEFFFYHLMAFKALLISKTNSISFERVCKTYNEMVNFFNTRLAGKFPFGGMASTALSKDIILFVTQYRAIREMFYNNEQFVNLPSIKEILGQLDLIAELFIVEGNNLFVNIKMECVDKTLPGSKNTNLILKFHNKFGDILLHSDSINTKYNIQESYTLEIEFIDSSILKLTQMNGAKVRGNNLRLEFFENFGFLSFVEKFRVQKVGEDVLVKLVIPVINSNTNKKSQVILFMKVFNWPIFPIKLSLLNF